MPFFCYQKGPSTFGMEILSNTKNSRPIIVSANKKTSQPEGYMMTSLIDMFQNKVNDYCSHDVQSVIG